MLSGMIEDDEVRDHHHPSLGLCSRLLGVRVLLGGVSQVLAHQRYRELWRVFSEFAGAVDARQLPGENLQHH